MCDERFWPDTTSYNAAISACEKGKHWELALGLMKECKTWATPDTISYNAAISACEKGGQWQHALALLQTMGDERLWPDTISYSAAISACEKGSCACERCIIPQCCLQEALEAALYCKLAW